MAKFNYRATDRAGKQKTGVIEASSEGEAIAKLRQDRLLPLKITPFESAKTNGKKQLSISFLQRVGHRDVMDFTTKMSTLSEAGIQLDRSLAISSDLTENPKMKSIIRDVRRNVQSGSSLADALARHPKTFNRLYINMVRSGEAGGVLETILMRLAGFLENSQELREEIISASIYPALLIIVGTVVIALMMTFVLPKFTVIFVNMGAELPLPTKVLVNVTEFVKNTWYFVIAGIALLVFGGNQYLKTDEGRLHWDRVKLRLPLVGGLIQKIEVARFARTLGTLVRSGVPILQALAIVKETLTNRVISNSLLNVYSRLKEGGGLANPLKETDCFPPLAVHMLAVGEETGSLESMLLKIADTYEKDVRTTVKRVMGLIEPILILTMGLMVGFIVVSMLMAVFSVSDMPM